MTGLTHTPGCSGLSACVLPPSPPQPSQGAQQPSPPESRESSGVAWHLPGSVRTGNLGLLSPHSPYRSILWVALTLHHHSGLPLGGKGSNHPAQAAPRASPAPGRGCLATQACLATNCLTALAGDSQSGCPNDPLQAAGPILLGAVIDPRLSLGLRPAGRQ